MDVFLIRHFESTKNLSDILSSINDDEPLTTNAKWECHHFAIQFNKFLEQNNLSATKINCTASVRAEETASIIASQLGNIHIESYHELKSTFAGTFAGVSHEKINTLDLFFSKYYYLYRKGIYNLYNFDNQWKVNSKETKIEFEERVLSCFSKIINNQENSIIIVTHRSPIIAILIHISRLEYNYSSSFYGHIEIDLGKVTWIHKNDNGKWNIYFVNEPISKLNLDEKHSFY